MKNLLALKWLRKNSNLQDEISEIKLEQDQQVRSVYINIFFLSFFLQRIFLLRLE